jgi:uncharacterized membrane protein
MLVATVLALAAAVLHAAWNFAVKQSTIDRLIALWGQFLFAGIFGTTALLIGGGLPAEGYLWAALSGLTHVPYCVLLARAYAGGDFSVMYPMARGGGALLAGIGGVVFLDDRLGVVGAIGMVITCAGLVALTGRVASRPIAIALGVAATIGVYTVVDAQGIRATDDPLYAAATFVGTASMVSTYCLVTGRRGEMVAAMRSQWSRFALLGAAATVTYTMVQLALRRAPVGYVTSLRESSVVIAAFLGAHVLKEGGAQRRVIAAVIVLIGLLVLIAGS